MDENERLRQLIAAVFDTPRCKGSASSPEPQMGILGSQALS